ncbi:MAG: GspH/FimT family pseudopilin [Pseudomonadota bacterium]|nr:MAG: type II secretion system protein GspH [Pseudomonadota bacterium]
MRPSRGFTLVELLVVVVLVAIFATIAVPGVVERFRERRSSEAAQRIAALYRSARMRALGRGAAVLVRFADDRFTVYEAIQGPAATNASCALLPSASCLTPDWANTANRRHEVTTYSPGRLAEGVTVSVNGGATALDVCFTPMGRAYSRSSPTDTLAPLTSVLTATVQRGSHGLLHRVTVLPNGIASVSAEAP